MPGEKAPIRPSIAIYVSSHFGQEAKLREVQAGIEEEGIPSSWHTGAGDAAALAYRGAAESQLAVGVGISAEAMSVHYRKLPADRPLFVLPAEDNPAAWRQLGFNAARLVKGTPFKDYAAASAAGDRDADLRRRLDAIVRAIINEKLAGHGR